MASAADGTLLDRADEWPPESLTDPTKALSVLMERPLKKLLDFKVVAVPGAERRRRAVAVGRVMLQLLAIQFVDLGEPLNLNSDMFQ